MERFSGRLWNAGLDERAFSLLAEARRMIAGWRIDSRAARAHTTIGGVSPPMAATRSHQDQNPA